MKPTLFCITAMAAVLTLGACSGKECKKAGRSASAVGEDDRIYTGVLPAADAQGVRYTLLLDYDDEDNGGDFDMVQTYFNVDSAGMVKDVSSFANEGEFTVGNSPSGQKYLKLAGADNAFTYFLVEGDSAVVMTGEDLVPPETPGMNYTLKAVR